MKFGSDENDHNEAFVHRSRASILGLGRESLYNEHHKKRSQIEICCFKTGYLWPIFVDTNTCIAYLNQSSQSVYKHLLAQSPEDIYLCDVVKYELYYGAYRSTRKAENLENLAILFRELSSLPFDGEVAKICGAIRADLQAKGKPIGAYDFQIAAIAIANNLTLVTHNVKEFERVPGLLMIDWQT